MLEVFHLQITINHMEYGRDEICFRFLIVLVALDVVGHQKAFLCFDKIAYLEIEDSQVGDAI